MKISVILGFCVMIFALLFAGLSGLPFTETIFMALFLGGAILTLIK